MNTAVPLPLEPESAAAHIGGTIWAESLTRSVR